jgi:sulfatase maturation enzyme AslB (radical SAM superfamily)
MKRKKQNIKKEHMYKILNELRDKNVGVAFHVLGEPLLNKQIFHYLDICDEYNINVHLVTNLTLLTTDITDKLLSHKSLGMMHISFQTVTEEDFKLRKSNLPFCDYLKNLEDLIYNDKRIKSNVVCYINVMNDWHCYHDNLWNVFTPEKWNQFIDITKIWRDELVKNGALKKSKYISREHGLGKHYTRIEDIPNAAYSTETSFSYEITPNLIVSLKGFSIFGGTDTYLEWLSKKEDYQYVIKNIPQRISTPCKAAMSPSVLSNGEITCCCLDYEGSLSLGNIENISLLEAINSPYRAMVMNYPQYFETCRRCRGQLVFMKKK